MDSPDRSKRINLRAEVDCVITEWRTKKAVISEKTIPYDRPSSVLKRGIYRLARELVKRHKTNKLAISMVEGLGHRVTEVPNEHVKLFLGLLNAIPDDDLARTEKHRYAYELAYARRHKVEEDLLIGFLLQTGAGKGIKRLVDDIDLTESWFPKTASEKERSKQV